jgi:hypothetical protein
MVVKRKRAMNNFHLTETTNFGGYGTIMALGFVGGIALYHLYGRIIDAGLQKVPYLNKIPSYEAEATG